MYKLDFQDGDFILVPPPTVARASIIRSYHQELLVRCKDAYMSGDRELYPRYKRYYEKVAAQLLPSFDTDRLVPSCRHDFFIGNSVIPHPHLPDKKVLSYSGLERLMGYDHALPQHGDEIALTCGEPSIDIHALVAYLFGNDGLTLIEKFDYEYLTKFCQQVINLRRGKEALEELTDDKERAALQVMAPEITKALSQHGFNLENIDLNFN